MQFLTATLLLAGLAAATPFNPPSFPTPPARYTTTNKYLVPTATTSKYGQPTSSPSSGPICLDSTSAAYLVNGYGSLLTAYNNATANTLLATNYTDTSDSINYLAGVPLGATTFSSRAAFEASQSKQPAIGFTVLAIDAVACTTLAFRWTATLGSYPVKGINVLYASNLNNTASGWQISQMFAEFNVGAWELDIGQSCGPYTPANGPQVV